MTTIKYVWLDENGARVSPVHGSFRAALNFINGWDAAYERLRHSPGALLSITKTGKPPVKLARVRIEETIEPLEGHETQALELMGVLMGG